MIGRSHGTVTIPEHVYGWPGVAFGGYLAGLLADGSPATGLRVTFHRPARPGIPLEIDTQNGERRIGGRDAPFATARPVEVAVDVPESPTWNDALRATGEFITEAPDLGADCFGCGIERAKGEGLRQFPGLLRERDLVVAAWRPAPRLGGATAGFPASWPGRPWTARAAGRSRASPIPR